MYDEIAFNTLQNKPMHEQRYIKEIVQNNNDI